MVDVAAGTAAEFPLDTVDVGEDTRPAVEARAVETAGVVETAEGILGTVELVAADPAVEDSPGIGRVGVREDKHADEIGRAHV